MSHQRRMKHFMQKDDKQQHNERGRVGEQFKVFFWQLYKTCPQNPAQPAHDHCKFFDHWSMTTAKFLATAATTTAVVRQAPTLTAGGEKRAFSKRKNVMSVACAMICRGLSAGPDLGQALSFPRIVPFLCHGGKNSGVCFWDPRSQRGNRRPLEGSNSCWHKGRA